MTLTPEQFSKLVTKEYLDDRMKDTATKDDFKKLEKKMDKKFDAAYHMFVAKDEFNEFKDEMMDMKKDVKKILNSVDGIAKKHQDFETELAANLGAHGRFEKNFVKTDKRVKILEKKLGVSRVAA